MERERPPRKKDVLNPLAGQGNDYHWDPIKQKMVSGLEPTFDELQQSREILDKEIYQRLMESKMLKGKGFIVVAANNPRFDGEEFEDLEEAKQHGGDVAHATGTAIVYAPVAVLRPRREVVDASPSKLLEQITGKQRQIPATAAVAEDVTIEGGKK